MKTRKRVATLFILGALLLSTVTPVLAAPSLQDGPLTPSIEYEVTACLEVTFTGSATGGEKPYTLYYWEFGDGEAPGTGQVVNHIYGDPGTYTVTLTVTDGAGDMATAERTLTLCCLEASASADPTLAEPEQKITFTGSATGGVDLYTYEWDFDDDGTDEGDSVIHAYAEIGIYYVTLTVTDATPCTAQDTIRVAVGVPSEHIISNLIAAFFILPPEYIDDLRAMGWGYGEIAMAYFLAQLSGEDIDDIVDLREEGDQKVGWGEVAKGLLLHPGNRGRNLGAIMSGRATPADDAGVEVESASTKGPKETPPGWEHGKGQGHGKGEQGQGSQGQGHDKGQGHGKGKGKGPKH